MPDMIHNMGRLDLHTAYRILHAAYREFPSGELPTILAKSGWPPKLKNMFNVFLQSISSMYFYVLGHQLKFFVLFCFGCLFVCCLFFSKMVGTNLSDQDGSRMVQ